MSEDEGKMPLYQHLEELRSRLLICFLAVGVGFIISYVFSAKLFELLMRPWLEAMPAGQHATLIYTAPHEAFFVYMKVSLIAGTLLAVPVILWQIWKFIAPGLYANEKKYMLPVIFCTSFCFVGGGLFGYFVVFPAGFKFFASFASENITPMMRTSEYLSFANKMLLCFGLAFELPVFAFFLAKLGILSSDYLKRKRKVAIILIFIAAALLTPSPDVISQLLMAGPLLVLYEISIWVVHFFASKQFKTDEEAPHTTA
ncbi:MAG: twin-arginine translocase subunit TatC [Desulfobacteraceae bacterium]|nr:twin-arginine translocase subunit TatC [Desulfobacteraceae bacterium]